jgi:hypothetical protein
LRTKENLEGRGAAQKKSLPLIIESTSSSPSSVGHCNAWTVIAFPEGAREFTGDPSFDKHPSYVVRYFYLLAIGAGLLESLAEVFWQRVISDHNNVGNGFDLDPVGTGVDILAEYQVSRPFVRGTCTLHVGVLVGE